MAKVKVEVEVSKESYELGLGLVAMVKAVKLALADGWQIGQDLPAIALAAFGQMTAVEGIDKIDDEIKEDPAAFGKAIALALGDVYGAFQKKDETPASA